MYDYFVKLVHDTSTKSQFATKRAKNPKLLREISQKSFKRYPANVPEKKLKKKARRIIMGYVADLAHIK